MDRNEYLGLGSRFESGPSELLVQTGFSTEIRQADYLHYWLGVADLAHVLTLRDAGVLPEEPGRRLLAALLELLQKDASDSGYAPEHGDTYNGREHVLRDQLGDDAGWLSLGRTRREAGRVSYYMAARKALLSLHETVDRFVDTAHRQALAHLDSWWADLTYWQPAQVSTFGHYLLSFAHEADRHLDRIQQAWARCSLVPVAAGGVAGTTVPLSRTATLRRLGLTGPATTSRDAMWSVDGLLDIVFVAQQTALTASRLAEDFLLFATAPFRYVRLHDSHCRASVYLPQKRNPYALSVVRGGYAVVTGRVSGVVAAVGTASAQTDNWIYNYGETLDAIELARQMSALMTEVLDRASFDTARMADLALDGFTEAADLAERLVAEHHIDYRTAHSLVARIATTAEQRGDSRLSPDDRQPLASRFGGSFADADPRSLVLGRAHDGSAAPRQVRASARRLHARLTRQRAWRLDAQVRADAAIGQLVEQARTATTHTNSSSAADAAEDRPPDPAATPNRRSAAHHTDTGGSAHDCPEDTRWSLRQPS
jgi:argininosuccinate lyase